MRLLLYGSASVLTLICPDDVNITDVHRAIYAARPDVGGIVNGSTPHCRAFAMNGMSLKMILQGELYHSAKAGLTG